MFSADNQEQIDNYISAHYGKEEQVQEQGQNWESLIQLIKCIQSMVLTLMRAGAASCEWIESKWTENRREEVEEVVGTSAGGGERRRRVQKMKASEFR